MVKNCVICFKQFNTSYINQKVCGESCRIIKIKRERPLRNKFDENKMNDYLNRLKSFDKDLAQWMIDNPITKLPDGSITIYGSPRNPNLERKV